MSDRIQERLVCLKNITDNLGIKIWKSYGAVEQLRTDLVMALSLGQTEKNIVFNQGTRKTSKMINLKKRVRIKRNKWGMKVMWLKT